VPDLAYLPKDYIQLRSCIPEGFTLSERIIEPIILIERVDGKIRASLAGHRIQKGLACIIKAPSNIHGWVVDKIIIRPLPLDAGDIFQKTLKNFDTHRLAYSSAIYLLRNDNLGLRAIAAPSFLEDGRQAAEQMSPELSIKNLAATLFPYQARGVQWMWETINLTGGLILADEMGLGKTIQIIALLLLELPRKESPALIVCPTSLIANWEREFARFAPSVKLLLHRGQNRTGIYRGLQHANVVIATYDTVVSDVSIFSSFEWSWVICDEAQAIKNPVSRRRTVIAAIPRRRTIPMTGTPVENSLNDLWSLADIAIPGLLGAHSDFEKVYGDTIEAAQLLRPLTDPIILKRRVADVAGDLPERIDIDVPLDLDDALIEAYIQIRMDAMKKYPVAGALVATLQLQMFCAHPWLCQASNSMTEDEDEDEDDEAELARLSSVPLVTSKIERTRYLLLEAFSTGKKVIVFSVYNRIGALLREAIGVDGNTYWDKINGSTAQEIRQQIVDEFSAHRGPGCLVLNPKAAGAGLNITAATVVIHFTPVWNPALEAQASARAHRRGQTEPVTVYRLFYRDTVEEVMVERSVWKSTLANESIQVSSRDTQDLVRALEIYPKRL
jgi:SNF2 family DNA or RNA helicase